MSSVVKLFTNSCHTVTSLVRPQLIKGGIEVLCSYTLRSLKYSAQQRWLQAIVIGTIISGCIEGLRRSLKAGSLNNRVEAYKKNRTQEEQKTLYSLLAPESRRIISRCPWENFKNDCLSLEGEQFTNLLETILDIQVEENQHYDWFAPLLKDFHIEDLCKKLGINNDEFNAFIAHAKRLAQENAPGLLYESKGIIKENFIRSYNYCYHLFECVAATLFCAYNISSDETPASPLYARMHLSFYYQLYIEKPFQFLSRVYRFLKKGSAQPWVPAVGVLIALAIAVSFIKLLGVVVKNKRANISNELSDLSKRAERGELPFNTGCNEVVVRMGNRLNPQLKEDLKWILLVGRSGSGKDTAVESFQKAIRDGIIPHLKNARVHEISTVDLNLENQFKELLADIQGNQDTEVLFLNEIHTAISNPEEQSILGNRLKQLSRKGLMIVGATTVDEFQKSIGRDIALLRRFEPIFIEEPTKEECIDLLYNMLSEKYPAIPIVREAIGRAYDYSEKIDPNVGQPGKTKDLLMGAIAEILSNIGKEESALLASSKNLAREREFFRNNPTNIDQGMRTDQLRADHEKADKAVKEKQERLAYLQTLNIRKIEFNKYFTSLAVHIANSQNPSLASMEQKKFILFQNTLAKVMDEKIKEAQENLENDYRVRLTPELIDIVAAATGKNMLKIVNSRLKTQIKLREVSASNEKERLAQAAQIEGANQGKANEPVATRPNAGIGSQVTPEDSKKPKHVKLSPKTKQNSDPGPNHSLESDPQDTNQSIFDIAKAEKKDRQQY